MPNTNNVLVLVLSIIAVGFVFLLSRRLFLDKVVSNVEAFIRDPRGVKPI